MCTRRVYLQGVYQAGISLSGCAQRWVLASQGVHNGENSGPWEAITVRIVVPGRLYPGIYQGGIPSLHASRYTLGGIYASLPSLPGYISVVYTTNTVMFEHGMLRFVSNVEEGGLCARGNVPFSPQEITSNPGETPLKGPTNPLQKGPSHKEPRNILTPPEMTSRPPRCYSPPFPSVQPPRVTPCERASSAFNVQKVTKRCPGREESPEETRNSGLSNRRF